jgi:hypothetical protein
MGTKTRFVRLFGLEEAVELNNESESRISWQLSSLVNCGKKNIDFKGAAINKNKFIINSY